MSLLVPGGFLHDGLRWPPAPAATAAETWTAYPLDASGTDSGDTSYLGSAAASSITIGGADATGSNTYVQTGNRADWGWRTWPITLGAGARHLRARLTRSTDPVSTGGVLGVVFANAADLTTATAYAGTYWWYEDTGTRLWMWHIHHWGSYGGWAFGTRSDLTTIEHVLTLDGDHAEILYSEGWGWNGASPSVYKREGYSRLTQTGDFSGGCHVGIIAGVRRASGSMSATSLGATLNVFDQSLVP